MSLYLAALAALLIGISLLLSFVQRRKPLSATHQNKPPRPISKSVYVANIVMSLDKLEKDRYAEFCITVFNGSERIVSIEPLTGQTGHVSFRAAFGAKPDERGDLPPPSITSATNKIMHPYRETHIILAQGVPANDADKILRMLASNEEQNDRNNAVQPKQIEFRFDKLRINIKGDESGSPLERLELWDGMTIKRGINYGRFTSSVSSFGIGVEIRSR